MAKTSIKHVQINKDQTTVLVVVAVAIVITIFGLFAIKALIVKGMYQRRALSARHQVVDQLKENYSAATSLASQYKVFVAQDPNVLGGSINGNSNLDGDNARIVLDSLPSTYDAPALATSIEKVLTGRTVTINSIDVTDDPITNTDTPQAEPKTKPVAFSFIGTSNYQTSKQLLQDFERSIRPFDVNTLELSGSDTSLKLTVSMTTYFQPARSLELQATKEVK
jgi:hypothetical protein